MERDQEFVVTLGDGSYAVRPFDDVRVERDAGGVTGHWEHFGLIAAGDDAAEVYRDLWYALKQRSGVDPAAAPFDALARYVRERGTRLSEADVAIREEHFFRELHRRRTVDGGEQYEVRLFRDVEIERGIDGFVVHAFSRHGSGTSLAEALQRLGRSIDEACGSPESPGPLFEEIAGWVRRHGRLVGIEILTAEADDAELCVVAHGKIADVGPGDLDALSSAGKPLLVYLWADWCGFCPPLAPVLADLAEQWADRLVVAKLDVGKHDDVMKNHDVLGIPALLLFRDGRELRRIVGRRSLRTLMLELAPHVQGG